jgi:hypothetical protein
MRISANEDDPGYDAFSAAKRLRQIVRIYLDDEDVTRGCITADDEEGFVVAAVLDKRGCAQVDPNDPESIWTEHRDGRVRIVIR